MNPREAEAPDKRGEFGAGAGAPPRRLGGRAELVNELARGGGGAGSPQVGWVGRPELLMNQPELFFTDYNNNIIPPTTWGVNPLLINIYYYFYFSKKNKIY